MDRLAPALAIDQPGEGRKRDPDSGTDQNALHGIADRQPKRKSGKDEKGEEASSGAG